MKNYEIRVFPKVAEDGSTYWTATFPSVPECIGGGDTPEEAMNEARENLEVYIEFLEEEGKKIPQEDYKSDYSGKIALRLPKSTHRRVSEMADSEGVSINTLLVSAIENYIGLKAFDIQFKEKIEALREISESSLYLQQCNALYYNEFLSNINQVFDLKKKGVIYE